jgi:hypothetical protein
MLKKGDEQARSGSQDLDGVLYCLLVASFERTLYSPVLAELPQDAGQAVWQAVLILAEGFEQPPAVLRNSTWGENDGGAYVVFVRELDFDAIVAQVGGGEQEPVLVSEPGQRALPDSLKFACVPAGFRGQFYHKNILIEPPSLYRESSKYPSRVRSKGRYGAFQRQIAGLDSGYKLRRL